MHHRKAGRLDKLRVQSRENQNQETATGASLRVSLQLQQCPVGIAVAEPLLALCCEVLLECANGFGVVPLEAIDDVGDEVGPLGRVLAVGKTRHLEYVGVPFCDMEVSGGGMVVEPRRRSLSSSSSEGQASAFLESSRMVGRNFVVCENACLARLGLARL